MHNFNKSHAPFSAVSFIHLKYYYLYPFWTKSLQKFTKYMEKKKIMSGTFVPWFLLNEALWGTFLIKNVFFKSPPTFRWHLGKTLYNYSSFSIFIFFNDIHNDPEKIFTLIDWTLFSCNSFKISVNISSVKMTLFSFSVTKLCLLEGPSFLWMPIRDILHEFELQLPGISLLLSRSQAIWILLRFQYVYCI